MGITNCVCIKNENYESTIIYNNIKAILNEEKSKVSIIQANWRGYIIRSKFIKFKNSFSCPGTEILPNQPITSVNKFIEIIENRIGSYVFTPNPDTNTADPEIYRNCSILYPDNSIYIGTYDKKWNKHGYGTFYNAEGFKYVGSFHKDKMTGQGRIIYPDGNYYEGDFKDDKPHGQGTFTFDECFVYKGGWLNETKFGYGQETTKDGSIYKGYHLNDMKHGNGYMTWPDGSSYKGNFVNNMIEGEGRIIYSDNKMYIGEFKQGKMDGFGIFYWPDKICYIGNYKSDKKNGFGTLIFSNSNKYEGFWVSGYQNGFGYFTVKNNPKLGEWRMGRRIRWIETNYDKNQIDDIEINKADLILMCKKYKIISLDAESIRNGILEAKL